MHLKSLTFCGLSINEEKITKKIFYKKNAIKAMRVKIAHIQQSRE
jgi:hypothetical protein